MAEIVRLATSDKTRQSCDWMTADGARVPLLACYPEQFTLLKSARFNF